MSISGHALYILFMELYNLLKENSNMKNYFAANLRFLRKRNGLSQRELANILSTTIASVCHWEKGIRVPNLDTIQQISDYFQVPIDLLQKNLAEEDKTLHYVETIYQDQEMSIVAHLPIPFEQLTSSQKEKLYQMAIDGLSDLKDENKK